MKVDLRLVNDSSRLKKESSNLIWSRFLHHGLCQKRASEKMEGATPPSTSPPYLDDDAVVVSREERRVVVDVGHIDVDRGCVDSGWTAVISCLHRKGITWDLFKGNTEPPFICMGPISWRSGTSFAKLLSRQLPMIKMKAPSQWVYYFLNRNSHQQEADSLMPPIWVLFKCLVLDPLTSPIRNKETNCPDGRGNCRPSPALTLGIS